MQKEPATLSMSCAHSLILSQVILYFFFWKNEKREKCSRGEVTKGRSTLKLSTFTHQSSPSLMQPCRGSLDGEGWTADSCASERKQAEKSVSTVSWEAHSDCWFWERPGTLVPPAGWSSRIGCYRFSNINEYVRRSLSFIFLSLIKVWTGPQASFKL